MSFRASASKILRPTGPVLFCALALSAAPACEDESEDKTIPVEQFVEQLRGATCERLARCKYVPDVPSCEAAIPTDRGIVQAVASVISGELTYDPAKGAACVAAVREYKCEGDYFLPRALRETCDPVFGKRKGEGAACFAGAECQGVAAECEKQPDCRDACCQGVCRLAGGNAGVGAPCNAKTPCTPDLVCLANEGGGNGDGGGEQVDRSCQPRVGPGAACNDPFECVEGYGCDPATKTCFKQADSGATCNPMLAAPGCSATADYCDTATSTCTPLPADGQPCVTNAFVTNACALYAQCQMGTCVRLPNAGSPCLNGQCLGLLECSGDEGGGPPDPGGNVCLELQPAPVCVK